MPIYDYRCNKCSHLQSIFVRDLKKKINIKCENCDSKDMKRLMSKLSPVKNDTQIMDSLGMPDPSGSVQDPRQIGRWVEKRFEDYGMDVPGDTREMIDAAREGEFPDPISDL